MHRFLKKIEKFTRNPWTEACIGIILLTIGLVEAGDSIFEDIASGNVGARHGLILLGLTHALKEVPSILGSLMLFADAEREEG